MYPYLSFASFATFWSSGKGDVTSRTRVSAPCAFTSWMRERLRALAMTLCPRARASRAMDLPKPLEAAVMNHTGVWVAIVMGDYRWVFGIVEVGGTTGRAMSVCIRVWTELDCRLSLMSECA